MIIPDGTQDDDSGSVDYMGALKMAVAIVVGILTVVGFGWGDLTGKAPANAKKSATESKKTDYEDTYLDEEISEDTLDEKDSGLK
tara:strand:- start:283 stop:537 length:255 start_codon:yes stop_codon:yes gene_type:complete